MSTEIITDGADHIIYQLPRELGGRRREVLKIKGADGTVSIADATGKTALKIDGASGEITMTGVVKINGAEIGAGGGEETVLLVEQPATPDTDTAIIYVDSTSKNLAVITDDGVVKHGVETKSSTPHEFIYSISDNGHCQSQRPDIDDLTGAGKVAKAVNPGSDAPTGGSDLPDSDSTVTIAGGASYVAFNGTYSANRVLTLGVTGSPITGECIRIIRRDTEAFTLTIKDDAAATLIVLPAGVKFDAVFKFGGTHFTLLSAIRIQ